MSVCNPNLPVNQMEGLIALPRKNGELVFQSPWEGRIFTMAVLLNENGVYDWKVFTELLIREISKVESQDTDKDAGLTYYNQWLDAFESILLRYEICTKEQIGEMKSKISAG